MSEVEQEFERQYAKIMANIDKKVKEYEAEADTILKQFD